MRDAARELTDRFHFLGLAQLLFQAAALTHGEEIEADDVFVALDTPPSGVHTLAQEVDKAEKAAIETSLARNEGQLERVARELAVSPTTLWRKMKRLGLRKD